MLSVLFAIVTTLQALAVTLDASLIRKWGPAIQHEHPGEEPVIAHYKKDKLELHYLAAAHGNYLSSPTMKLVNSLFVNSKFDVLLVEPFPYSEGQSPAFFVKEAKNGLQGDFILGGESALAIIKANQRKIPFYGGEPDHKEIYKGLKTSGYTDEDVMGFYVVRQVPQWLREGQNETGLLERNAPLFISTYCKKFPLPQCPSLRKIRDWYKLRMGKELAANIINEDVAPIENGKLFTQKMAAAVGDIRDRFTLKVIESLLNQHKRIAVVYGSGHFVTLRKSFDAAFGAPKFEKAR